MTRREHATVPASLLSADDLHLFNEGSHARLYDKLGAHLVQHQGKNGAMISVWAPDAVEVSVLGDFNAWNRASHPLYPVESSGIWSAFAAGIKHGDLYKLHVRSRYNDHRVDKADPFAVAAEEAPRTASRAWSLDYTWGDAAWMKDRGDRIGLEAPVSIYELHLGSFRRVPEEGNRPLSYRELAGPLVEHVRRLGFTHVELMPVMEHPFYGSWGYQSTGYFAATSRYGTPQDLMFLIDALHQAGIGVILDWVPSHFPNDAFALAYFDGTHLFEHKDPREGYHPDWGSLIFNYGRREVQSFLISSALFWLDRYHADGLRVDAVASMLYRDYSRKQGEWVPNAHGGRENLEAIAFIRKMNEAIYAAYPDVHTFAEESTAFGGVSRPTSSGGLGFGYKWDMGWMHDTLTYMQREPIHRAHHQDEITFRMVYAFNENFVLPLSHDEVVHGKGSLLAKMPGDDWQKRANLRLLYAYMYGQPGKKLLFMGGELGQTREWDHESSLDWHLDNQPEHRTFIQLLSDLNGLYRRLPALHRFDVEPQGFEWVDFNDRAASVLSFLRHGASGRDVVLVACNFTPVPRHDYRVGVPAVPSASHWRELFNSDAKEYGGSGTGNLGKVTIDAEPWHGRPQSLRVTLPPLAAVFFAPES